MRKNKVLMLVTAFAPDSIIAAVRPSMFARYLTEQGYEVTIVRSGRIDGRADDVMWTHVKNLRIFSYEGNECAAEKYSRGEGGENMSPLQDSPHFRFIQNPVLRRFLHILYDPFRYIRYALTERKKIKVVIDSQLKGESFDVVYATYGDVANVLVSDYAAKVFGSKLIIDLRDAMCVQLQSCLLRMVTTFLERKYLQKADVVTCVTEGLTQDMKKIVGEKAVLLYNGYMPQESHVLQKSNADSCTEKEALTLFYGGNMYGGRRDFSALFSAINELVLENKIDLTHIRFVYAGASFEVVRSQAEKYGVEEILENRGYVSRSESDRLQCQSDIFLVATWNTKKEQGIMTGKFYESIRNCMPIIAVVTGDKSDSEIGKIINQYGLGACYEQANHEYTYVLLKEYLEKKYRNKIEKGEVEYLPKDGATQKFSYKYLSAQMAEIIESVVS